MLDAFIIEELRRREQSERDHIERPHLELPLDDPHKRLPTSREDSESGKKSDRGVIIIDY